MKSMDVIRNTLNNCERGTFGLIEDMRDAPLTQPTSHGGNHPHWVLGHLTLVEGNVPALILGEKSEVQHLAPLFAAGTEPKADGAGYPSYDELLGTYRRLRQRNLEIFEGLGEAGLDKPLKMVPQGLEKFMRTAGDVFVTIAMHQMGHRGQIADARRVAGRKPVFTPGPPVPNAVTM
jgi:hypothetical protein